MNFYKSCLNNKSSKKATKKPSPLYQVLFIDCLRKVIDEPYFSNKKIDEYLNIITKNNHYDFSFQKTRLIHLINMDKNKYDLLSGNKLGEIIKDITNTDISSLRKAAAVIKKPERERTLKQKKEFKNESLIRTEIHQIITELGNS